MKKIVLIFVCFMFLSFGYYAGAQNKPSFSSKYSNEKIFEMLESFKNKRSLDINPTTILNAKFKSDFPGAKDIDWEKISDYYEVEFEIGNRDCSACYDTNAELLYYMFNVRLNNLPAIVKNAAITKYPDYDFEDIKEIHLSSEIAYKIELEKHDIEVILLISQKGRIIREY